MKIVIIGDGKVGHKLAVQLSEEDYDIVLIDQNEGKLKAALNQLDIFCITGNGADAMVSLTGLDEENIILSLFAKTQGVNKIIAKVNEDSRAQMVEGLGIDSIISAKSATADAIMRYVRARKNSYSNANVETMYRLVNGKVEAQEFIIRKECEYTSVPLKELRTKKNTLIACIGRHRQVIIPNGDTTMKVGDSVIVVTKNHVIRNLNEILL